MFDEWYVAVASTATATTIVVVAAATPTSDREMTYREFSNTKPLEF